MARRMSFGGSWVVLGQWALCGLIAASLGGCGSNGLKTADAGDARPSDGGRDQGSGGNGGSAGSSTDAPVIPGTGGAIGGGGSAGTIGGTGGSSAGGSAGSIGGTGGAAGGPGTGTAMDLCMLYCQRVTTCDTSRDLQTCVNSCTNANAAQFPKLRVDLVASILSCVRQKDCATITQVGALKACADQAAAGLGPSAKATAFCDSFDAAETQCGITIDKTACLVSAKIYDDGTVAEATACSTKSCALIYSCVAATLTESTGASALGGGIKPGKRCGGTAYPCSYSSGQAQCQQSGCTFGGYCSGTIYCAFQYSQSTCQAIGGCTWGGTTCTGTPTVQCASFTNATSCPGTYPCYWYGTCTGTVVACSSLGITACANHGGCIVQDAP
jgi:hypothetical protein